MQNESFDGILYSCHCSVFWAIFVQIRPIHIPIEDSFVNKVCDRLQVVRMFIAVVTIFAICWLPYHMFYVYAYHQPHITSTSSTPHLFLAFYWLAMANSMVNPIIYYWMNRRFRHYFQRILCFCCFRLWKIDDSFVQRNTLSIERKPRLCKYTFPTTFYLVCVIQPQLLYATNATKDPANVIVALAFP